MSTGPVAERSRGPRPASRTCCPPTSLPLRGGFPAPPSSAPKRKSMPQIPRCLLAKFPLSGPFSPFFYSKGKVLWFRGGGSRFWFFQIWQGLLVRFPMGGPVWFLGLLGATHSWRSTSLSRGGWWWWCGRPRESSASCSQAPPASWRPDDMPSSPLCPENSAASLRDSRDSLQPDLPGLVHTDHISISLMTCTASGTS